MRCDGQGSDRLDETVRGGSARYVDTGNQRIFYRTEVDDKFARHGLGGRLASAALDNPPPAQKN